MTGLVQQTTPEAIPPDPSIRKTSLVVNHPSPCDIYSLALMPGTGTLRESFA